jgi:hypothetical protein
MRRFSRVVQAALILVMAVLAPSCSDAGAKLSLEQFRDRYVEDVARRHPGVQVRAVGDDEVEITRKGKEGYTTYLGRAYDAYRESPEDLEAILTALDASAGQADAPAALENLLVLVRPETFDPGPNASRKLLLSKPLGAGLMAVVAVDSPNSYVYAPSEKLRADLKLDDAAIWSKALANTRVQLTETPKAPAMGRPVTFTTGTGLAASILMDDAFWDSPAMTAAGPLVVSPMGKDFLMLALQADAKGVAWMRKAISSPDPDPEKLAYILMVRKDGRWAEWP